MSLFADQAGDGWLSFAQMWGPAVPMFAIFCWYLNRLIFRVVPKGFRSITETILRQSRIAGKRHRETVRLLKRLEHTLETKPVHTTNRQQKKP